MGIEGIFEWECAGYLPPMGAPPDIVIADKAEQICVWFLESAANHSKFRSRLHCVFRGRAILSDQPSALDLPQLDKMQ